MALLDLQALKTPWDGAGADADPGAPSAASVVLCMPPISVMSLVLCG